MDESMIENMCQSDDESEEWTLTFLSHIERRTKIWQQKVQNSDTAESTYYYVVRGALWDTFKYQIFITASFAFFGEACSIGYTMFLSVMINFLKDTEVKFYWGPIYAGIFALMMMTGMICRNQFIMRGSVTAVTMRKTLIGALYNKISNLSMKSLTETNSGKLITIISGDI